MSVSLLTNTVSGTQGQVIITSATGAPEVLCTGWVMDKGGTLQEATNSTSGGWEKRRRVKKGGTVELDILWDSVNTPEDATLDFGDELVADLRIGESAKWYIGVPLIVDRCQVTGNTQEGLVASKVTAFINGPVADPTTRP